MTTRNRLIALVLLLVPAMAAPKLGLAAGGAGALAPAGRGAAPAGAAPAAAAPAAPAPAAPAPAAPGAAPAAVGPVSASGAPTRRALAPRRGDSSTSTSMSIGAASAAMAAATSQIADTPAFSPNHLDFGEVWDGQSALRTLSLTTTAAGTLKVELPSGPFFVTEIRELSPPKPSGSKNNPSPQPMIVQDTKGKVSFPEGQPGPWTYPITAGGNQILVHVVFKPKFDFGTMMAGAKSAAMKISGPKLTGTFAISVPLAAMFDGKHTSPILILPQKELVEIAAPWEQVKDFTVRLVGAGEEVSGRIVWPSASPGLKVKPYGNVHVGGSETKEFTVPVEGTGGHSESTPLDGTVAFEFTRQGQTVAQQTPAVPFRVTFIPGTFHKTLPDSKCNGVELTRGYLTAEANGSVDLNLTVGPEASDSHFEVFFPEAGRVLFHATMPADPNNQIVARVEENGPITLGTVNSGLFVDFEGHMNPGPPDTLDRYLALMRSTAKFRCW